MRILKLKDAATSNGTMRDLPPQTRSIAVCDSQNVIVCGRYLAPRPVRRLLLGAAAVSCLIASALAVTQLIQVQEKYRNTSSPYFLPCLVVFAAVPAPATAKNP